MSRNMASAATAKRKVTKAKLPKKGTIELAPADASLSEKRRIAALISWEKRRINAEKRALTDAKNTSKSSKKKDGSSTPVTPPGGGGKKKTVHQKQNAVKSKTDMFRSKNAISKVIKAKGKKNVSTKSLTAIRSEAARLGWERRKRMLAGSAESSAGSSGSGSDESSDDEGSSSQTVTKKRKYTKSSKKVYTASARRQAAIKGWQRRNSQKDAPTERPQDPSEIRRQAAKLGWERRKRMLAESSGSAASSDADASSGDDEQPSSADEGSKKIYTADARRQAAIRGWERRRNEMAARRNTDSSFTSDDVMSIVTAPKPSAATQQPRKETKQYREGTKRSRRLALEDSAASHEEETRKVNELVTYLRVTRGWMEFHPSSRLGSGTAVYGYIPSSLATYIRDGTINQSTVLQLGTLGIHYALDWDGYGGLRDMIATFGEDYSPYPTEEMMEQSRVPEWELGEDLPWREVEEAEEKKLNERIAAKEQETRELLDVATILANLDREAVAEEYQQEKLQAKKEEESKEDNSPSLLALKTYESSGESSLAGGDNDSDDEECSSSHMNHCEDKCTPTPTMNDGILIISNQLQSSWNFGLC